MGWGHKGGVGVGVSFDRLRMSVGGNYVMGGFWG